MKFNKTYKIRKCGLNWKYCTGECITCAESTYDTSTDYTHEEVYGKQTTTNGKTEWFGTHSGKHID